MAKCHEAPVERPAANRMPIVAVVGNPNSGKTSLFNSLTGASQKVGNYPGVTVERVSANLKLGEKTVEVIDVPGLYSLSPQSADEQVALDTILGSNGQPKPDLLVCVVNAASLERNLFLYSQIADTGVPVVVALTMADLLLQRGEDIDITKLSNLLEVDVVPVLAHKGKGMAFLKEVLDRNLKEPKAAQREFGLPAALEEKVDTVHERMARFGMDTPRAEIRIALLKPESQFGSALENVPELLELFQRTRKEVAEAGVEAKDIVANRYQWTKATESAVITSNGKPSKSKTEKIDKILTHRFWGLLVFVAVMYLVFQSIYTFSGPLMQSIEGAFSWFGDQVGAQLAGIPWLRSLVVDGIIAGMSAAMVFLPQILVLFLCISVLEGTGYLARAAFLMDRLLGWCGLNGRAFIPLLSSFACAIPGIMAARVMPDPKSRLATILVAPLMSCSARLPVYVLLIGAFIEPRFGPVWAGFTLFAMHFLGLAVAIPIVAILNRGVIKAKRIPFLLELPPYQLPNLRDVWIAVYQRGKVFVTTAGTMIFMMSVLIWAASYFPRPAEADARYSAEYQKRFVGVADKPSEDAYLNEQRLEHSFLGRFGRAISPVFAPAGFDWRITTSILAAFPAREVVVPSMRIMLAVGDDDDKDTKLRDALKNAKRTDGAPLMDSWTAVGLMVFFALCAQCMATLATVKRETNSTKWAVFMFSYMTILAYVAAVFVHQLGVWFGG
jgi:ferrous iron transport protein B